MNQQVSGTSCLRGRAQVLSMKGVAQGFVSQLLSPQGLTDMYGYSLFL